MDIMMNTDLKGVPAVLALYQYQIDIANDAIRCFRELEGLTSKDNVQDFIARSIARLQRRVEIYEDKKEIVKKMEGKS